MKISLAHHELIEELRANNTVSRERLAAFENDPVALADFMSTQADDFIRREMHSNELVHKRTEDALVSAEPEEQHLVSVEEVGEAVFELRREFKTGDEILHTRVQELEQKVKDLTEQLSIFNRVSDIALKIALQWINTKQST